MWQVQHADTMHPDQDPGWTSVPPVVEHKVVELEYQRRNLVPAEAKRQAFWECAACDFPFSSGSSGGDINRGAAHVMRHAEQRCGGKLVINTSLTLQFDHSHLDGPFRAYLRQSADSMPHCHPEVTIVSSHLRSDTQWAAAARYSLRTSTRRPVKCTVV